MPDTLGLACEHGMLPRACEVCFAAMLRELDRQPDIGRLLHASPKAESASENAELLADLDYAAQGIARMDRLDAESAAKTIRALEAKVRELESERREYEEGCVEAAAEIYREVCADRDRLAAEVDRQRLQIETMRAEYNARAGMHMLAAEEAERLGLELAAAREELAHRREHMRRGIEPGRPTGGEG